ncbi:unnamed protein product [Coregonus sp. 'balchen']|nr:unnamed protein product [Coregonus sp. 'balchen']
MVERLCQSSGTPLYQLDQPIYHNFPSLHALADSSVEACLRVLGFGYRARFLQQSAREILDSHGGPQWLPAGWGYTAHSAQGWPQGGRLCVSDGQGLCCACGHVWQIAKRGYSCAVGNGQKSLTDKVHCEIGDFFRQLWGPYAGWAHSEEEKKVKTKT